MGRTQSASQTSRDCRPPAGYCDWACEWADFTYLLGATGVSKGNLSAHLSRLDEAGYVRITKGFKGKYPNTVCALTAEGRRAFSAYREQQKALARHLAR